MAHQETPEYKALQRKWYKKLKDQGFKDLEFNETSPYLADNTYKQELQAKRGQSTRLAEYFRLAGGWYWHGEWDSELERWLWLKHCEGLSCRETAAALKKKKNFEHPEYVLISKLLKKARARMLASKWFLEQDNE